jgi:hypothetical protein
MAAGDGLNLMPTPPIIAGWRNARLPGRFLRAVLLLLLLSVSATAEARQPAIDEIVVANSDRHALLYAKVVNGFTPEMENALQNGMPVTFTFLVELYKNRDPWPAQRIAFLDFDHTLSYDNLKEEYRIELQEKGGKTFAALTLNEAMKMMTEINGLRVMELAGLDPDGNYLIKIRAKLARKVLPLDMQTLIPFWGLRDFKTDWHLVEFRY